MAKLSRKLIIALKTGPQRMYRVAQEAGVSPTSLSKLINGIAPVQENDPRIIRVGKVLGLSTRELFERR